MYKLTNKIETSDEAEFSICSTLFNEENNVEKLINEIEKISSLLKIKKVVLLDNGSTDSTKEKLLQMTSDNILYNIISNKKNSHYTDGIKRLLSETSGERILIFHSDLQYNPYDFVYHNLDKIKFNNYKKSFIIAFRTNRLLLDEIISVVFRIICRITLRLNPIDYNAQPKIFLNNIDPNIFTDLDGFAADLAICKHLNNLKFKSIDISESRHQNAISSWNFGFFSKIKLTVNYLKNIRILYNK